MSNDSKYWYISIKLNKNIIDQLPFNVLFYVNFKAHFLFSVAKTKSHTV